MVEDEPDGSGKATGELPDLPAGTVSHVAEPLPGDAGAAAQARRRVRGWCRSLDVPEAVADDLVLAVSEIVTNAAIYGAEPVWLRLALVDDGAALALDVYDAAPVTPRLRAALADDGPSDPARDAADADALPTGGRGLHLVLALADRVGLLHHPRVGKTVRALFSFGPA